MLLLDLANLFALPAAVAAMVLALALLVRARRWLTRTAIAGLAALALLAAMPPGAAPQSCTGDGARLRVAFLNTQSSDAPAPIMAWIERERPDVIAFAEMLANDIELRGALAEVYPYRQSCMAHHRCPTILYSRIQPVSSAGLARGDAANRKALSAARIDLPAPGAPLTLIAAHLSHALPLGKQDRELAELQTHLDRPADTVILGDFNATPRMHVLRRFAARSGLRLYRSDAPTWPVAEDIPFPLIQIDQAFAGRNWQVAALRTSQDLGSDHRGILAELCRL